MQSTIAVESKQELKVLSWNIYMLPFCFPINSNWKRADQIAKELAGRDYDIIIFQEAFDFRARRILQKKLGHAYPFRYGPVNESFLSFRTNSGIWVLSKIPLRKLEEIEFENCTGVDALARKGAVLFEGSWQGQPFQLAGTHLQADSPDEVRRAQCREIESKLLQKYSKTHIPQIVCGDFNIDADDLENYHAMLSILKAQNGSLEGSIHSSYDEIDNQLAKCNNGKKRLIDYVLLCNANSVKEIRRWVSVLKENMLSDLSDHYGIAASINFGNAEAEHLTAVFK